MEPGTSMYLPTGTPHAARAQETASLHVTIGINQTSYRDTLKRIVADLLETPTYADRLPAGWLDRPETLADGLASRLRTLADELGQVEATPTGRARGDAVPVHALTGTARSHRRPRRARLSRGHVSGGASARCDRRAAGVAVRPRSGGAAARRSDHEPSCVRGAGREASARGPRRHDLRAGRPLRPPRSDQSARARTPARPGGSAQGVWLNAFRCSDASMDRDESQIGSASRVRGYFLLECPGRWGQDILRDAQLPRGTRQSLAAVARLGVKVLLIRRHGRRSQLSGVNVFAAYADPVDPWLETAVIDSFDEVAGMDLSPLATGGTVGLTRTDARLVCVCTHGRHDVCCAEQGRPVARALERSHPDVTWEISHIGGDRFAGNLLLLPHGLYYGRVTTDSASTVVSAYTAGSDGAGAPARPVELSDSCAGCRVVPPQPSRRHRARLRRGAVEPQGR